MAHRRIRNRVVGLPLDSGKRVMNPGAAPPGATRQTSSMADPPRAECLAALERPGRGVENKFCASSRKKLSWPKNNPGILRFLRVRHVRGRLDRSERIGNNRLNKSA